MQEEFLGEHNELDNKNQDFFALGKQSQINFPTPQKRKNPKLFLVIVIIVMFLIILGILIFRNPKMTIINEIKNEADKNNQEEIPNTITKTINLIDFTNLNDAEKEINSTQGKQLNSNTAEHIVQNVVNDQNNENVFYFATSDNNQATNFVGIYSYNTQTHRWHRFFKSIYEKDKSGSTKMLRVIGRENDKLIIFMDTLQRKQTNCESFWLLANNNTMELVSLNLSSLKNGLEKYNLPQSIYKSELEKQNNCLLNKQPVKAI